MIEFIKSPVGQYRLAYAIGDTVSLAGELEKELIENGYAVEIPEAAKEDKPQRLRDTKSDEGEAVPDGKQHRSGRRNNGPNK